MICDLLSTALEYAGPHCWSVIPLLPAGKTPYMELLPTEWDGKEQKYTWARFKRQRASVGQVRSWWTRRQLANIGLCTGEVSGFFVLDCDSMDAVVSAKKNGVPGGTPTAMTGKGAHFYFRMPDFPVGNRAGILPGMDIRGTGGYVVAPPSIHPSGRVYRWLTPSLTPTQAPTWLLELLRPKATVRGTIPQADRNLKIRHGDRYSRAAFNGEYLSVLNASEGARNDALNRACYNLGQLVGDGLLDRTEVENAMLSAALSIGQNEREARPTIASGVGDGIANPRSTRPHVRSYSR